MSARPVITFDTRELDAALADKAARTKRDMAKIANQAAFNVAARAMRGTTPGPGINDVTQAKWRVKAYLGERLSSGRFGSRHKRASRQLRRVLLIAQAAFFKKHGHGIGKGKSNKRTKRLRKLTTQQLSAFDSKGKLKRNADGYSMAAKAGKLVMGSDYGEAMTRYVGKIFNKNVRSVGYLKAVWVNVLRAIAPFAPFKKLATGLPYGVKWRTSSAFGAATAARPGENSAAFLDVGATAPRMTSRAQTVVSNALQKAIRDEAEEMRKHEREMLTGGKP